MKNIEITDELYNKIVHEESSDGMPFEPCIWKLIKERNDMKKMTKEMMGMMLGAAMRIPPDVLKKRMQDMDGENDK